METGVGLILGGNHWNYPTPRKGRGGGIGLVNYLAPTPCSEDPTIRREAGQQGRARKGLFFFFFFFFFFLGGGGCP